MTHKALSHRMSRMEVNLQATVDALSGSSSSLDATAIELHSDRLADIQGKPLRVFTMTSCCLIWMIPIQCSHYTPN